MRGPRHLYRSQAAHRIHRVAWLAPVLTGLLLLAVPAVAPAVGEPPIAETITVAFMHQTSLGPFDGSIVTHGVETAWRFESASGECNAQKEECHAPPENSPAWTLIPGDSGTIPTEEAKRFEHTRVTGTTELTSLIAETSYYVRLVAENTNGKGSLVEGFVTGTRKPVISGLPSASGLGASSFHIADYVVPNNSETHWHFEYDKSLKTLEEGLGEKGPGGVIGPAEADEHGHSVSGELEGLTPSTVYYVRLVADNGHGGEIISGVASVETAGPPLAETFAAHGFDGETMRVLGSVEPHGYDTHYDVEYVTQAQFDAGGWSGAERTSPVDVGAGEFVNGQFPVTLFGVDLPGLGAGTSYRYRVVASSTAPGEPVVYGADQALSVPVPGSQSTPACANHSVRVGQSAHLPDCRAYEQVTPVEKQGAQDVFKYGITGEGTLVGADGEHFMLHAPGVEWGADPDARIANYFFARTQDGWRMTSARPQGETGPFSYQPFLFSADLTQTGLEAEWHTSDVGSSPDIELETGPAGGPYRAVASVPRADVEQEYAWTGASEDFSKLVLATADRSLVTGQHSGTTSGDDLYEWSGGELSLIDHGIGVCGARLVDGFEDYEGHPLNSRVSSHAVSADGSRVFFEAVPGGSCSGPEHLYMHENTGDNIDIGVYRFLAADASGSRLLLEKREGETHELVLYDSEAKTGKTLFSAQQAIFTSGDPPVVSEDLTAVYFLSSAQLTPEAPPPTSQEGIKMPENVYRFDIATGTLRFVVQTDAIRGGFFTGSSTSPDGRYYYWISTAVAGIPGGALIPHTTDHTNQVYRYDSVEGVVQCMSCASPFDPRPGMNATFLTTGTVHPVDGVPGLWDASGDGDYVFFDTPAALIPEDVDGEVEPEKVLGEHPSVAFSVSSDVYEWRKDGIDGCGHVQGCLALISSGTGGYENQFLGTTLSGSDVFFATHESLVPGDRDTSGDVYDARIGGGFAPAPPEPTQCEAGSCQVPVGAPVDTTPSSLSFSSANGVPSVRVVKPPAKTRRKASACNKSGKRRRHGSASCRKARGKRGRRRARKSTRGGVR